MRFNEFQNLYEKKTDSIGYYTVGDSHAVGLANYAQRPWVNKGKNGTDSDDSMHMQAINSIPKGSVVLISVGANDTFAGRKPQTIAASVAKLVNASEAAGHKVFFLLFPIGTKPNAPIRRLTRQEIKKVLSVPIIDLEGSKLVDGVHANPAAYIKASNEVLDSAKPSISLGSVDADPGAPSTKEKSFSSEPLKQGPPYSSRQKPQVIKLQTDLENLGYSVGRTGKDGRYGPYTAAAVAAFKKDYDVPGGSAKFDKSDFDILDKVLSGSIARVNNPTKSNKLGMEIDIPALTSVENVENAKAVAEEFLGRRMNSDEWKHLIQTITSESTSNQEEMAQIAAVILNRTRVNYGGRSTVVDIVWAPGQFQPVTGSYNKLTKKWSGPNKNFLTPAPRERLARIIDAIQKYLPEADDTYLNFSSANPSAYDTDDGRQFLRKMKQAGGVIIGGTIFATLDPKGQAARPKPIKK